MDEDQEIGDEGAEEPEPTIELGFGITETDVEERVRNHREAMWKMR